MITSNQFEHSLTIGTLDICAIRDSKSPELLIARKDQEGDPVEQIILSAQEVTELLHHLTNSNTQAVFRPL